jgi:hypothetical protein
VFNLARMGDRPVLGYVTNVYMGSAIMINSTTAILLPGLNQFFFFRWPSITISGLVAQLLSFPMGRAWAKIMPRVKIFGVSLNPGPFTVKEHVLLTVMATVTNGSAYATDIIAVQRVFYGKLVFSSLKYRLC